MRSTLILASLAIALLAAASTGLAEDVGDKLAPVGQSIKQGAQETGSAIENGAKSVGSTVKEKAEPAGKAIANAADKTHDFLARETKPFRDGAEDFFKKVGRFFTGD